MKRVCHAVVGGAIVMFCGSVHAVTLDGVITGAEWGAPLATNLNSSFGTGNDLEKAYGQVQGGDLWLGLTGDLEPIGLNSIGNTLYIMVDSRAGGFADGSGLLSGLTGPLASTLNGSSVDAGFSPDIVIEILGPATTLGASGYDIDIDIVGVGVSTFTDLPFDASSPLVAGGVGEFIFEGITNGVSDGTDTGGLELRLDAAFLANDGQPIRAMAFIGNGDGSRVSNEFLASLPAGSGPIRDAIPFDLNTYEGNQYFTIPEPGSLALLGLGTTLMLRRIW